MVISLISLTPTAQADHCPENKVHHEKYPQACVSPPTPIVPLAFEVITEKDTYYPGEFIIIKATANKKVSESTYVFLQALDDDGPGGLGRIRLQTTDGITLTGYFFSGLNHPYPPGNYTFSANTSPGIKFDVVNSTSIQIIAGMPEPIPGLTLTTNKQDYISGDPIIANFTSNSANLSNVWLRISNAEGDYFSKQFPANMTLSIPFNEIDPKFKYGDMFGTLQLLVIDFNNKETVGTSITYGTIVAPPVTMTVDPLSKNILDYNNILRVSGSVSQVIPINGTHNIPVEIHIERLDENGFTIVTNKDVTVKPDRSWKFNEKLTLDNYPVDGTFTVYVSYQNTQPHVFTVLLNERFIPDRELIDLVVADMVNVKEEMIHQINSTKVHETLHHLQEQISNLDWSTLVFANLLDDVNVLKNQTAIMNSTITAMQLEIDDLKKRPGKP